MESIAIPGYSAHGGNAQGGYGNGMMLFLSGFRTVSLRPVLNGKRKKEAAMIQLPIVVLEAGTE